MCSFFRKKLRVLFFIFGFIIAFSCCAWGSIESQNAIIGQGNTSYSIDEIIQQQQQFIKILEQDTETLQKEFENKLEDERALVELRLRAQDISKRALEAAFVLRAPLNDINALLDQLEELHDDLKKTVDERSQLMEKKAEINSIVLRFEAIFLATNRIVELAISQSRVLFKRTLTHRLEFSMPIVKHLAQKTKEAASDFLLLLSSWWNFVFYFKSLHLFLCFFIPLFIALGLSYFSRKILAHVRCHLMKSDEEISYLQRLLVAFISVLLPSLICFVCVYLILFLLDSFGLDPGKLTTVFETIGYQIVFVFLINRLAVVLLASNKTRAHLFNIIPSAAYQLVILVTFLGGVLAFDAVFDSIYQIISASLSLTIAKSFIAVFLVAILLLIISFIPLRFRRGIAQGKEEPRFWPFYIRIPLIVLGILLIVMNCLGYIGLARFIVQQIIIGGAFLVLMYLGVQSAQALGTKGQFIKTSLGHTLMHRLHLDEKTMNQLGGILSIFLNLVVVVFCAMPIAVQFGFSYSDLNAVLWQLMTGFQIGNVFISLTSLVTGTVAFFICWFLIRQIIAWLDGAVLEHGEFDSGVRNSIKTVIGYSGIVVSALIGISMAGFDLKNFALIAGGLSLGIGFGLQNIVQNFVSGLIILIGRPFKIGDYVESGSVGGIVKRISVRATELETLQRKTIIIPNSSLINNNVSNWTRQSKMGRIDIPVAVSANITPERVVEILLEIASATEGVLKNPAPQVSFTAFDSKKFSFNLAIYVPNITSPTKVTNALRFVLYKRFVEEGILEC
ncbi:mechanosensitive ion channel domain-containing protein [Bartonella krasnovii]|uniref:Mechanosensitive ion channel n=1 Tax=Bartonella krasnovii TaxID=2267275 RepID=A0ABY3VT53_9HYPH|nr:mechanosensitive ion channel domain-containing protein [Bartonella krasnovii]UNF28519.1 mechanosensitive ion channel [Bartonella krasnovii]UNF34897.1 mechanosensitive ion channel [Bartonella krasnovii]UNF38167.1 mechanosensitive ion channel [Bartonella krasnovii]UNF48069.1 mechanosensitive ion channel [Bartonella krasnovii]UNF49706.1 mechanosensitive ion channel [Bartonella krasnovii]